MNTAETAIDSTETREVCQTCGKLKFPVCECPSPAGRGEISDGSGYSAAGEAYRKSEDAFFKQFTQAGGKISHEASD